MTFEWKNENIRPKLCIVALGIITAITVYFSEITIEKVIGIVRMLTIFFCVYCAVIYSVRAYFENNKLHGKYHPLDDDEMWDLRDRLIQAEYEIDTLKKEIQRKY